jgi:site-specific recombinase XerD
MDSVTNDTKFGTFPPKPLKIPSTSEIITPQPKTHKLMAKKLLDQARDRLRTTHYSFRTEETYIDWMRRYILFHRKRHPGEMGEPEIQEFLTHLASERNVAASTQNQALSAILFLYREVLHKEVQPILLSSARRPERLPTVLTREETLQVIDHLEGKKRTTT